MMWLSVYSTRQLQVRGILRHLAGRGNISISGTAHSTQQLEMQKVKGETNKSSSDTSEDLKKRLQVQFSRSRLGHFTQAPPQQENSFTNNAFLSSYLTRVLPHQFQDEIRSDLTRFGKRAVVDIYPLGRECELSQPYVRAFDAWGNRTDEIVTCQAWKDLKRISAEEGLIAIAYEEKYGEYDRLYQMVKLSLFSPVSGFYSCPLAMTDGAAKTAVINKSLYLEKAFQHLTSRDPQLFWTSGQWMTEKRGGSDVSGATETVAVQQPDGSHHLFGYKWFSSATDSDMSLTLANIISEDQPEPKPHGLTMFYLETRNDEGKLNGIEVIKLKNKLGTHQLPTAELLLDGTVAYQVCPEGRGIASIANMLTITRMHNAIMSIGIMRRITHLARDYSLRRSAFGQVLDSHALHQLTASRMEVATRGCEIFTFHLARLLGKEEAGVASQQESLVLRCMSPILKFFTAKMVMQITSEGLECFGGQGYIEDTGLPAYLRDAQVLPIWEGTSNIMSLDFLRALVKSKGEAFTALYEDIKGRIMQVKQSKGPHELDDCCQKVMKALVCITNFMQHSPHLVQLAARDIANSLAYIYIGSLLVDHAAWEKSTVSLQVAKIWCIQPLTFITPDQYTADNHALVMEGYDPTEVYGVMF